MAAAHTDYVNRPHAEQILLHPGQRKVGRDAQKDRVIHEMKNPVIADCHGVQHANAEGRKRHRPAREQAKRHDELQPRDDRRSGFQLRRQQHAAQEPEREKEAAAYDAEQKLGMRLEPARHAVKGAQYRLAERGLFDDAPCDQGKDGKPDQNFEVWAQHVLEPARLSRDVIGTEPFDVGTRLVNRYDRKEKKCNWRY